MISKHAEAIGVMPPGTTEQLIQMIEKFHLPTQLEIDSQAVYQAITHDKKSTRLSIKDYFT
jgi:3-dehydroquinate synthase